MAYPSIESPERRADLGYLASLHCSFSCRHGSYSGIMENLAVDGAYLVSDSSPPEGCRGNLLIEEKDGLKLRLSAQVVHDAQSQIAGFKLYFPVENLCSTLASLACCGG